MTLGAQRPHPARACWRESPSPLEGEGFSVSALRLAGLAGALLGWRPFEFWDVTPAELAAVFSAFSPPGAAPVGGDVLAQLREQYPDG